MNMYVYSLLVIVFLFKIAEQDVKGDNPMVTTQYGKIRGVYGDNVAIYYGIPFAKPPVDQLRWNPPEDLNPWGDKYVYNATYIRPACPQSPCGKIYPPFLCPLVISEDCLYLNIFTPKDANPTKTTNRYPVMLFIHGGDFLILSGASPLFDGRKLAGTRGVILVTFNYRLGALGFLVTGRKSTDAKGNYGILDQQLAIKWVKDNIKDFGGDPSKVTLFGQSAGAQSVLIHYTLPSSSPYFRNAIIQSSPIAIPYKRYTEALIIGSYLAVLAGCLPKDIKCLRTKSAAEIVRAQFNTMEKIFSLKLLELFQPWAPFVDEKLVFGQPLQVVHRDEFSRKPLIIGTVSEEAIPFVYRVWDKPVSSVSYGAIAFAIFLNSFARVLEEYSPWNNTQDERETLAKMSNDLIFACSARNGSRFIQSHGVPELWTYVWDHALSFPGWGNLKECDGRVCHGSELVYLFHSAWVENFTFTADEEVLSGQIMDFWTNFAKWDNPNAFSDSRVNAPTGASENAKWPVYGQGENWPYFRFKSPVGKSENNYRNEQCNFWDTIGFEA